MDGLFDTYKLIFLISAIICAVFFIISLVLFIKFNIPKVIGDITGITAKRAVKRMMEESKNRERNTTPTTTSGKIPRTTQKMSPAANEDRQIFTARLDKGGGSITNGLGVKSSYVTTVLGSTNEAYETQVLSGNHDSDAFTIEKDITMIFTDEIVS